MRKILSIATILFISLKGISAFAYEVTPIIALHNNYMDLMNAMNRNKDVRGVEDFLQEYDGTIYADKLREKYLKILGKNKNYDHFLTMYKSSDNLSLQCYYHNAEISQGQKNAAYVYANAIWQFESQVPDSCNALFKNWMIDNPQNEESLFERFYLALQAQQWAHIQLLRQFMDSDQLAVADYWVKVFKKPVTLSMNKLPQKPYARLIVLTALQRQLKRNQEDAEQAWHSWSEQYHYTNDEVNNFIGKIVIMHAKKGDHYTEQWAQIMRPGNIDPAVYEWRVRSALLQNNWPLVQRVVQSMPKELRDKSSWSYWLARAYDKQGMRTQANSLFHTVAKNVDYYGFMAQLNLGKRIKVNAIKHPSLANTAFPFANEVSFIQALRAEKKVSEAQLFTSYLESVSSQEQRLLLAKALIAQKWYSQAIRVAKHSSYANIVELEYPMGFRSIVSEYAHKHHLHPAIVFALMRQESFFQSDAQSSAGAMGLMQLMPSTARMLAKGLKLKLGKSDLIKPQVNVSLGTAYLKQLLKKFHHPVFACAAYNAGARTVLRWQDDRDSEELDLWIETIPFTETREYVKKVMQNYVIYQYRLGEQPQV